MIDPPCNPARRQLVLHVEVPRGTPADAQLFACGDFNAWHPSNPSYRLSPTGNTAFRLVIPLDTAETKFKITRGSWETAECNLDGTPAPDHQWMADEVDEPVVLTIESWNDLNPAAAAFLPRHTVTGDVRTLKDIYSPQLDNYRDLLVYLPPSYRHDSQRRYPVIYMHDGQNLFDAVTAYAGEWQIDESCERLAVEEQIEFIIVGIPNSGRRRLFEYSPWHDAFANAGGDGDRYLSFMVDTVIPAVNTAFRTRPDASATGILGSSMGGLISVYAGLTRPDVFGLVGAMSSSLLFAGGKIFEHAELRELAGQRIYLDCGGDEFPGLRARSRRLVAATERMAKLLSVKGADVHLVIDLPGRHHESAWARRFPDALRFLRVR